MRRSSQSKKDTEIKTGGHQTFMRQCCHLVVTLRNYRLHFIIH